MIGSTKPMGSLSPSLLARKGQARPAMRSQALAFPGTGPVEDLGWNDMGANPATAPEPVPNTGGEPVPQVLVEREALKASIEAPAAAKPVSVATATRLQRETAHAGKAAFTLRVDAQRHLKLRIASAITNRSAQDLVTQALDALLDSVPEVEALVAQLPRAKSIR